MALMRESRTTVRIPQGVLHRAQAVFHILDTLAENRARLTVRLAQGRQLLIVVEILRPRVDSPARIDDVADPPPVQRLQPGLPDVAPGASARG